MLELMPLLLFLAVCAVLLWGYPVAFSLAGTSLVFAAIGALTGMIEPVQLNFMAGRLFKIMDRSTLIAVPLFIFMGLMLERTKIAEDLLESMATLFGKLRGGMGFAVTIVGMLLAASTGIVGATVVTMGLLSLPAMLKRGYKPELATGVICASGTLGQIIPPSIVLVLLGDVLANAMTEAKSQGLQTDQVASIGDLFMGAVIPGMLLVIGYMMYIAFVAWRKPQAAPAMDIERSELNQAMWRALKSLSLPLILIVAVLGSILYGIATPTEAAAIGAFGAMLLAAMRKQVTLERLRDVMQSTVKTTSMVFLILIGASIFSLVFRMYGGDEMIRHFFTDLPGGLFTALLIIMIVMFLLGFILDFIEITFVVVPIVGPVLLMMGADPIWLGVLIAINLQTSFLTPPFGFALFYLRGVAPKQIRTAQIYRGVIPFIGIQATVLALIAFWPELSTWLPSVVG
ncbi:TRAP transporter large permease [Kangiella sediminilitoris]|uniref:TRAP transporter large permease protein n=1 Tax=Kangiella sediminilitoris TaxID=1144748 RepID=A0A1B3B7V1_9GAMM|nr:TRAP transporter large permease subunit [Kangiella sediminilitoris]AOE48856.1 TRAP dicarboxylate transporter, DctM subunit [Kangiella sediminilitoris]